MSKLISKTDYLVWRDCQHNAWTKKWRPDIYYAHPPSEFDQHLITTGNQVEEKARELFVDGVLIEGRDEGSLNKTKELLTAGVGTLFQACFSDGTLFAAMDVLKQNKDGELSIYEIKASNASKKSDGCGEEEDEQNSGDNVVDFSDAKAVEKYRKELLKDPHLYDLVFQVYLAKKVGYKVIGAFLVRLNKRYIREEDLNLKKLFVTEDVLRFVEEVLPAVDAEIGAMIKILQSPEAPSGPCSCIYKGRSNHCTTFCEHNKDVPEYSVHDLTRIGSSKAKLAELIDSRIYNILDIPDESIFGKKIQKQIKVHRRGEAEIEHALIKQELEVLKFPLYFLDYESFNPAIPRFIGYRPYQHIPFQFSLDRLDAPDAELTHEEFLYTGKDDPAPLLVKSLRQYIGKEGSVLVWYKPFEESHINKHLAIRLPEYADFLYSVNARMFDLMTIFSKQLHVHPDFHGSASIKKVLPVLCPELSYKELDIGNGSEAMNTWNRLVTEDIPDAERVETEKAMKEYCGLDTYAMYAILKHLYGII